MGSIQTAISIADRCSSPLKNIAANLNTVEKGFEGVHKASYVDSSMISMLAASVDNLADKFDNAGNSAERASGKTGGFFKSLMGLEIVKQGIALVTGQLDSAISRMDTMNNFDKVMGNMGVGAADARMSIHTLSENLQGLPTTLNDAAASVQRFTSSNGSIKRSTDMFLALNNAIIAGGADTAIQQSALEQLSQSYAKGKPDMMEWRTAVMAMPAQLKQVAQAMGYASADALGESLRSGKVSMDEFMDTIITLNNEGVNGFKSFDEQARAATDGFATKIANAKSAVTRGVVNIVEGINTGLENSGLPKIQEIIEMTGRGIETVLTNIGTFAMGTVQLLSPLINGLITVSDIVQNNWAAITPILYGVAAAVGVIAGAYGLYSAAIGIATIAGKIFNATLWACPVTWVVIGIAALVAILVAVAAHFAQTGGAANTTFGVICGWISVVIAAVKNAGLVVANVFAGIWNGVTAITSNMITAFNNAISRVQAFFYNLLSTAASVIEGIASALNELPFVDFDFSGISAAASNYAAKSAEAEGNIKDYKSVADAFTSGMDTFDAFQSGWSDSAYKTGAAWGDGMSNKITSKFSTATGGDAGNYEWSDSATSLANQIADNTGNTSKNTAKAANSLDTTAENLKYLRDIAERDVVNRYTTANVKLTVNNDNKFDGGDSDSILGIIQAGVQQAVDAGMEGVVYV